MSTIKWSINSLTDKKKLAQQGDETGTVKSPNVSQTISHVVVTHIMYTNNINNTIYQQ